MLKVLHKKQTKTVGLFNFFFKKTVSQKKCWDDSWWLRLYCFRLCVHVSCSLSPFFGRVNRLLKWRCDFNNSTYHAGENGAMPLFFRAWAFSMFLGLFIAWSWVFTSWQTSPSRPTFHSLLLLLPRFHLSISHFHLSIPERKSQKRKELRHSHGYNKFNDMATHKSNVRWAKKFRCDVAKAFQVVFSSFISVLFTLDNVLFQKNIHRSLVQTKLVANTQFWKGEPSRIFCCQFCIQSYSFKHQTI